MSSVIDPGPNEGIDAVEAVEAVEDYELFDTNHNGRLDTPEIVAILAVAVLVGTALASVVKHLSNINAEKAKQKEQAALDVFSEHERYELKSKILYLHEAILKLIPWMYEKEIELDTLTGLNKILLSIQERLKHSKYLTGDEWLKLNQNVVEVEEIYKSVHERHKERLSKKRQMPGPIFTHDF